MRSVDVTEDMEAGLHSPYFGKEIGTAKGVVEVMSGRRVRDKNISREGDARGPRGKIALVLEAEDAIRRYPKVLARLESLRKVTSTAQWNITSTI